jgi:hypothetical protein
MKAAWIMCSVLFLVGCQPSDPKPIKSEPVPTEESTERAPQLSLVESTPKPVKPRPPAGQVFADDPDHQAELKRELDEAKAKAEAARQARKVGTDATPNPGSGNGFQRDGAPAVRPFRRQW